MTTCLREYDQMSLLLIDYQQHYRWCTDTTDIVSQVKHLLLGAPEEILQTFELIEEAVHSISTKLNSQKEYAHSLTKECQELIELKFKQAKEECLTMSAVLEGDLIDWCEKKHQTFINLGRKVGMLYANGECPLYLSILVDIEAFHNHFLSSLPRERLMVAIDKFIAVGKTTVENCYVQISVEKLTMKNIADCINKAFEEFKNIEERWQLLFYSPVMMRSLPERSLDWHIDLCWGWIQDYFCSISPMYVREALLNYYYRSVFEILEKDEDRSSTFDNLGRLIEGMWSQMNEGKELSKVDCSVLLSEEVKSIRVVGDVLGVLEEFRMIEVDIWDEVKSVVVGPCVRRITERMKEVIELAKKEEDWGLVKTIERDFFHLAPLQKVLKYNLMNNELDMLREVEALMDVPFVMEEEEDNDWVLKEDFGYENDAEEEREGEEGIYDEDETNGGG